MKYQKYITVMQMAMGVTASNKDCLPSKRQLWVPPDGDASPTTPGYSDGPSGATGGAGAIASSSTLSLPMNQGKPSLRRIKGRIHRSKSLDSLDLLDNVSLDTEPAHLINTLHMFRLLNRMCFIFGTHFKWQHNFFTLVQGCQTLGSGPTYSLIRCQEGRTSTIIT